MAGESPTTGADATQASATDADAAGADATRAPGAEAPSVGAPMVKFCGIRTLADADAVNQAMEQGLSSTDGESGANVLTHVGLVFWPKSKRFVTHEQAARIACQLNPRLIRVGVFVDASIEEVATLLSAGVIDVAQLHGSEDGAYIAKLRARLAPNPTGCIAVQKSHQHPRPTIWKAFEVHGAADVARANESSADFVLLDAGKGCGKTFDWRLLAGLERPFALAGGLGPDTLPDVVAAFDENGAANARTLPRPALLDVSSGIESALGKDGCTAKDPALMARFLQGANRWRKPAP